MRRERCLLCCMSTLCRVSYSEYEDPSRAASPMPSNAHATMPTMSTRCDAGLTRIKVSRALFLPRARLLPACFSA